MLVVSVTCTLLIANPGPLFPYSAVYGRLDLRSDHPFNVESSERVLADAEARIARSVLDDHRPHSVVIANSGWHERLFFLWNAGAGGVNYYPLTRSVYLRSSNIDTDRVIGYSGKIAQPPRTLAYFIAHEIGHTLVKERTGIAAHQRMPTWIQEGVADYIGFGSEVEIEPLLQALKANDPTLDPQRSGYYARYRLLVAIFLNREHWTMDQLIGSNLPQAKAEQIAFGERR